MSTNAPHLDPDWILNHLVKPEAFEPVPHPAQFRGAWDKLAGDVGKPYVQWADANMDYVWPSVLASHFMAYGRHADRLAMEEPYFDRRMALQFFVMAECLTWQGKYLDQIIDGLWAVCEETYWCFPPHMGANKDNLLPNVEDPILDLFAGSTGQQMAWTVWLLKDQLDAISPEVCKQVQRKVKFFVLDAIINHPRHWLGLDPQEKMNNWTPWVCATYLSSAWILEDDKSKFDHAIRSVCNALNVFMSQQPEDGGCDEGVMYWSMAGGSLYECLDQLGGMTGQSALLMDHPLIRKLAKYPQVVHVIGYDFACFADGQAYASTIPGEWISKWARDIGDESLKSLGHELLKVEGAIKWERLNNFYRQIQTPFLYDQSLNDQITNDKAVNLDHWLEHTQVMTARSSTTLGQGWHLSAKGGHNDESHNHNDIGQFIIYRDGHPLFIDLGVEAYTGKTFGPQRYDIFTMQSQWHNLLTFGHATQLPGREYEAKDLSCQPGKIITNFSLSLANAYGHEAGLKSYHREIQLDRTLDQIRFTDTFVRNADANTPVTLSLITVSKVSVEGQSLLLQPCELPHDRVSASAKVTWEGVIFDKIQVEEKRIDDLIMQDSWGQTIRRIKLSVKAATQGQWEFKVEPV